MTDAEAGVATGAEVSAGAAETAVVPTIVGGAGSNVGADGTPWGKGAKAIPSTAGETEANSGAGGKDWMRAGPVAIAANGLERPGLTWGNRWRVVTFEIRSLGTRPEAGSTEAAVAVSEVPLATSVEGAIAS